MEKLIRFQIAEVQPQSAAQLLLNFLLDGLQNSNYWYPGYTTSHGFRQCDKIEKLRNASSLVDELLTTMDAILHHY